MKKFSYMATIFLLILSLIESIYSMQITDSSKMLLGATNTFNIQQSCKEIIIPNNFQKLILDINSQNLNAILITDSKIGDCQENYNITKCCARNSTFCIENISPTTNKFKLNYCIRKTYLYACILIPDALPSSRRLQADALAMAEEALLMNDTYNSSLDNNIDPISNNTDNSTQINSTDNSSPGLTPQLVGTISINTTIIKGEGCQTAEFIPEVGCSSLGLLNCKDPQYCSDRCMYVECRTALASPDTRVFSMCLPVNLTDSDITNRCSNHIVFNQNTPFVYKQICQNSINNNGGEIPFGTSSHTFFKFLVFIMGAIIIVLFTASVYYRFSKKYNDGTPPFEAPWFFPNFIFPQ